jgi:hypothetical protein
MDTTRVKKSTISLHFRRRSIANKLSVVRPFVDIQITDRQNVDRQNVDIKMPTVKMSTSKCRHQNVDIKM